MSERILGTSLARHRGKLRLIPIVTALVTAVDQLSKLWVSTTRSQIELLPGILHLVYVENRGAAFGLLASHTELLIALNIAGLLAILVLFRYLAPASTMAMVSFALILGGALGNLIDRLRLGFVIDFISVRFIFWPPFNVADVGITAGVFALIYVFYQSAVFGKRYGTRERSRD